MMRQVRVTGWWLSVALVFASASAHAEFVLKAKPRTTGAPTAQLHDCVAGVQELGDRPSLRSLLTHGTNKDASVALRSLVPTRETWRVDVPDALGTVSWSGGKPWPDIVADIAATAPICVQINWITKSLVARKASRVAPVAAAPSTPEPPSTVVSATATTVPDGSVSSPLAASPVSKPSSPPDGGNARDVSATPRMPGETFPVKESAPPTPVAPTVRFALREGETLRKTLERWSKDAKWKLVWDAQMDYPISVSMTFPSTVSFREAVAEVLRSYWHLPYALEGRMYQNRVLEIVGRTR